MTGNKQYFIDLIIKLWKGQIIQDNVSHHILPAQPATLGHVNRQNVSQPVPVLQSSLGIAQKTGVPKPPQQIPVQPVARVIPQQSLSHVFKEIKSRIDAILNTPEKLEVYNIICGYNGIKKEEILNVLSVWPPSSVVNPDEVMLKIIAKRQVTGVFALFSLRYIMEYDR